MANWYWEHDILPGGYEQIISEDTPLDAIVHQITDDTGLARGQHLPDPHASPG